MTGYGFYIFILCFVALFLLVGVATVFVISLVNHEVGAIKHGVNDADLKQEEKKDEKTNMILSIILLVLVSVIFAFSLCISFGKNNLKEDKGTLVVASVTEMSKKNEKNTYLFTNDLGGQFNAFDLIKIYKAPLEEDVGLYDVVVYRINDQTKISRVVAITVKDGKTLFTLRGDALIYDETAPISYDQITGVYKGEKIPFVGSIVEFMSSPVGYLIVIMTIAIVVLIPIMEKKIKKVKEERIAFINEMEKCEEIASTVATNEPEVEEKEEEIDEFGHLKGKKDDRSFDERLSDATIQTKERYEIVNGLIERVKGLKKRNGKNRSYYNKRNTLIKMAIKGKTLNLYLALDPKEYENTKFVFSDASEVKKYSSTPMRVKLSSDRQARYAVELITALAIKNSLNILEVKVVKEEGFSHLKGKKNDKTFKQKLRACSEETKNRYKKISEYINGILEFKLGNGKKSLTYKYKNKSVAKLVIKGKTLNVYLALPPKDFENTKYKFSDVSAVKKYASVPMRLKISSERQARWTLELIEILKEKIVK